MRNLYLGRQPIPAESRAVAGELVHFEGQPFYCISNYDRLRPFFMTIVSSADLWMFISSNGALTAGRRNPDLALFPYYTDDKIHDSTEITGPKTILIAQRSSRRILWEPFSQRARGVYRTRRNLYKSLTGNRIIFEEINQDLNLTFRYGWSGSEKFGWVRTSWLRNSDKTAVQLRILDGLQNLMPCGVNSQFQLEKSTLVDAYKKSELLPNCSLGLFLLSSIPVDRAEPAESLRATSVWSDGIRAHNILLSSRQLDTFRQDEELYSEPDVRGERGAFFVEAELSLGARQTREWLMVGDVDQGPSQVTRLRRLLRTPDALRRQVKADMHLGTDELRKIVAQADGLQTSARPIGDARHFNNVLFNVMRGGIFPNAYAIDRDDLQRFVNDANRKVAGRQKVFFGQLGPHPSLRRVLTQARLSGDPQLERLCSEYLPLTFSRRHGDPSRPWNRFSIPSRRPDGLPVLHYEGNWRDIFQNWEALAISFPAFAANMVCKFVNASTADGYNPYRITGDGIDWEVPNPQDPWAHIGYWGDHQIIYFLKLLEILESHEPEVLQAFLTRRIFSFACVPYQIKPYAQLLEDPRETVEFIPVLHELTQRRVQQVGSDGKLVWHENGEVRLVNLTEKLLIPLLAKFSNFIPGGGIWLNTQRPEWNDANNALVGNGVSMVTLYQLRRHLAFCARLFARRAGDATVAVSSDVRSWFGAISKALRRLRSCEMLDDRKRRETLDRVGTAGATYRRRLYARGPSGRTKLVTHRQILAFLGDALVAVDRSIRENRRPDGLYHSYNLAEFRTPTAISLRRLPAMLEGQVAVLGAQCLTPEQSLEVLSALRQSAMFRKDQHSYTLYPDRQLPRFIEKNNLPPTAAKRSRLIQQLIGAGNRNLAERDSDGVYHFNPAITNANDLRRVLHQLSTSGWSQLVAAECTKILSIYERLFDHRSFTGRSGTFFGYEGLGSIYWHMVSKLLLAAQEAFLDAARLNADPKLVARLAACYYDIRKGIGDFKSPLEYGAFPMDPYSHTPAHAGARQPGLTGQVKEDVLCRFGELGVTVQHGRICFLPQLLRPDDFLLRACNFDYIDVGGVARTIHLNSRSLAFTYCQVPIIYELAKREALRIQFYRSATRNQTKLSLNEATSRSIFERRGKVRSIKVCITLSTGLSPSSSERRISNSNPPATPQTPNY